MKAWLRFLPNLFLMLGLAAAAAAGDVPQQTCSAATTPSGEQPDDYRAAYEAPLGERTGRIIDLTFPIGPGSVTFGSPDGLPEDIRPLFERRDAGDICNQSRLRLPSAHTGTHLDAPSHFDDAAFQDGRGVESLSLETLNGPALVVDVPHDTNITAAALQRLGIPKTATRVLFRTLNTERQLMRQRAFDTSYTAFSKDGGEWLAANTAVRLVGVDYLSVAVFSDLQGAHEAMLGKGIIAVEGLNLERLRPGLHDIHCLPMKLAGSDGAPVRCIAHA